MPAVKVRYYELSFLLLTVLHPFAIIAQQSPGVMQQYLTEPGFKQDSTIIYSDQVKEFYSYLNYQTAWIQQKDSARLKILLENIETAERWGLIGADYQYKFLSSFRNRSTATLTTDDSLQAELLLTDAAIHYYSDIAFGNVTPSLNYFGIDYSPRCRNIPVSLAVYILKDSLSFLASALSPQIKEAGIMHERINQMVQTIKYDKFKEVNIVSKETNPDNQALLKKLFQLGLMKSITEEVTEDFITQKIKEAQRMFNLPVTGILNDQSVRELNVPLQVRLKQLNLSINYYRWLACLTGKRAVILINIPAAYMKVYKDYKTILEMKMVLGKSSTPTIPMGSEVYEVIAYPYWYVPFSIATREILPAVKRNVSYLKANKYQVINQEGKVIDPNAINWNELSRNYFPYTIRQATGCDNSLGRLKLNFHNPFNAYLHDTNSKGLFSHSRRFYSHGCMRMEKPFELGSLVLKNNAIAIDTFATKGCLNNQPPVIVPVEVKMPVIAWYNPAGIDSLGNILFFEDVYRKFNWKN